MTRTESHASEAPREPQPGPPPAPAAHGDGAPKPAAAMRAQGFGIPGLVDVEADADGWTVNAPGTTVKSSGGTVSIETPVGNARFGGSGGSVDTPFGSVGVDEKGVSVRTPWGNTTVRPDGSVSVTDSSGRPIDVPAPGGGGGGGGGGVGGAPFEIPIPIPRFRIETLEIPITVPKFSAEPLAVKVSVPEFEVKPLQLPLQVPTLAGLPAGISAWQAWLAGFPDVAVTPSPMGPVPIPYPNLSGDPWVRLRQILGGWAQSAAGSAQGAGPWTPGASGWAQGAGGGPGLGVSLPPATPWLEPPAPWVAELSLAVARAVARWQPTTYIAQARILGPILVLEPGSLRSDVTFGAALEESLAGELVPKEISEPAQRALARAWHDWQAGCSGTAPAYPAFAAWPGPSAPPMPNVPAPLVLFCGSGGLGALLPAALEEALLAEAGSSGVHAADPSSARQLARWFFESFVRWCSQTQLMLLMGSGPVPSFAPPFAPVGPVIGGTVAPTRGILIGPNAFAQTVPWNAAPPG